MSPRTKTAFEALRQKSKEAIQATALELFAHNGYHSTSISQIAKEAGISKGLMYNYFTSKEALLESIIMEAVEMGEKIMDEVLAADKSPLEMLIELTEASFQIVQGDLHYWKLMTSLAFQTDVLTSLEPLLKKQQEKAMQTVAALFSSMGAEKAEYKAWLYGAAMDGIMLHYMQMAPDYPLEQMKQLIIEQFIQQSK
ncbi:MAG TPA: TetR/AcrR family transcriptional regulator [Saprospiraceae bacterium]|nr:TetR/AcrR family transcriptional regulator [Saprospiraceae bacterium]HMQ81896.1 TetR/AcrR family transcriptional regulator [Saprospiraceae bacterium]